MIQVFKIVINLILVQKLTFLSLLINVNSPTTKILCVLKGFNFLYFYKAFEHFLKIYLSKFKDIYINPNLSYYYFG